MGAIATVPLEVVPTEQFPVLAVANGIVPDEALAISLTIPFNPNQTAFVIDVTEAARKFNTIPIQGVYIDMSGSAVDLMFQIPASDQMILAKSGTQGYYAVISPMPVRVIVQLSAAPSAALGIPIILYNSPICCQVWGFPQGAIGPQGPQGATGPQGPPGAGAPPATTTQLGSVIVGSGLTVQSSGLLSVAPATVSTLGGVIVGGGLVVQPSGLLSVAPATSTTVGGVMAGSNVVIAPNGSISVPVTSGFQTPWLSNINGAGYTLSNASGVGVGTTNLQASVDVVTPAVTGYAIRAANVNANLRQGIFLYEQSDMAGVISGGAYNFWHALDIEGADIYINRYRGRNVLIGTSASLVGINQLNPAYALDVAGQQRITGAVAIGGGLPANGGSMLDVRGGRSYFSANNEPFAIGARYVSTGGTVYFGASDATTLPDAVIWTDNGSIEVARFAHTGDVGIGTQNPLYRMDIRVDSATAPPQVHIAATDVDSGMYLLSGGPDLANVIGGASWTGTSWQAKSTNAEILQMGSATMGFYLDSGLTSGVNYVPTIRMRLNQIGLGLGTAGIIQYRFDIRTPESTASQVHIASSNADDGGYLASISTDGFTTMAGMAYNGTGYIHKSTSGLNSAMYLVNGSAIWSADMGLAPGQPFSPTAIATLNGRGLYLGSASPTHLLQLAFDDAAKPGTSTWTVISDGRTKRNVRRFDGDMEVVRALNPTVSEYNGRAGTPKGARVVSFDADDLEKVLPHAVHKTRGKLNPDDDEETDIKGINMHEIIIHMLRAVQMIDKRLTDLERKRK